MKAERVAREAKASSENRFDLWLAILHEMRASQCCEVGVLKGVFAKTILDGISSIESYIFVDPWMNLPDWNKPANTSNEKFESIRAEALSKTSRHAHKITELRMATKDAVKHIEDESLDFVYIDGDHTLRGITIDLISLLPKMKENAFIGGDDFTKNIWQHGKDYDPTEIFPFAVYFAEANDLPIITLPYSQFLMQKSHGFKTIDLEGYCHLTPREIYSYPKLKKAKRVAKKFAKRFLR